MRINAALPISAQPVSAPHALAHSPARSAFVDFSRALAVLMMLQGHGLDALLASDARTGTGFYVWSFLRGLTPCTFLLLSGFAFTVATRRRWTHHLSSRTTIVRRLRRFAFFLLLGYALHFPVAKIAHIPGMTEEHWRGFLIVDVLQCIAVMLTFLQVLVLVARTPRAYALVAGAGCVVMVALTPAMWRSDWTGLPMVLAAYLSPAAGSLFPLFPWGAYILLGALVGEAYVRSGTIDLVRFANRVLFGGGAVMVVLALVFARMPFQAFGPTDFWSTSPNQFLLRAGLVLLILSALAHVSRVLPKPTSVVQALAQESLTIYAVHLCIVYGSIWNVGLRQIYGPTLPLTSALGWVAALWASLTLLACGWNWCKRRQPEVAQWVRIGVAGVLFGKLL